jgi:hypothetical protein
MYSTCIFCHGDLGSNEALERFPIGRRLAFDPERGRLWVICLKCGRWNLSPVEERWEALESCDRLFHDSRLRVSTGEIGLARLREGLELVRIGEAQRPELAAWRYGAQLVKRRRTQLVRMGIVAAVGIPLLASGAYSALMAVIPGGALAVQVPNWIHIVYQRQRVIARTRSREGDPILVRGKHVRTAELRSGGDLDALWHLELQMGAAGSLRLQGEEAVRVLSRVLARVNQTGGSQRTVRRAVQRLDEAGTPATLFSSVAALSSAEGEINLLARYPEAERLALEMATHEASERRAMEGELSELARAWEEAEEIAAIADTLLLPPSIEAFLAKHRSNSSS